MGSGAAPVYGKEQKEWKSMLKEPEMQKLDQQKIIINDLLMDCIAILRGSGDHADAFNNMFTSTAGTASACM